jgi:hypothetical protein
MKVGLKLEEIQMTPNPIDSIVNLAFRVTALRTGKFATPFEIYVNIELLFFPNRSRLNRYTRAAASSGPA